MYYVPSLSYLYLSRLFCFFFPEFMVRVACADVRTDVSKLLHYYDNSDGRFIRRYTAVLYIHTHTYQTPRTQQHCVCAHIVITVCNVYVSFFYGYADFFSNSRCSHYFSDDSRAFDIVFCVCV